MSRPTVYMMKGYTHAELAVIPGTPVSNLVGDFIRDRLTEYETLFDPKTYRTEYTITGKYACFNPANNMTHIPVAFADDLAWMLRHAGYEVVESRLADYPLRRIKVEVKPEFHDRPWQVNLIKQCSNPEPGLRVLAAQTGKGKTYSAIRAICNLGYASVVIAPGLADQWIEKWIEYTGREDLVYKIQEFPSLKNLMDDKDLMPGVFVCSTQTMQSYCKGREAYKTLPYNFTEFFRHYGIGIKVVDEGHMNFHANVRMDLKCNVPYPMIATATPTQNNKYAKRIFDKIYPENVRYGLEAYDRYVDVYFYNYSGTVDERRCTRRRGYSHMLYEKELLRKRTKFEFQVEKVICPAINQHFIPAFKPGYKGLIFVSTVAMAQALTVALQSIYPQLNILEYVGSSDDAVLEEADIFISTPGKAGTGLDVKNLIFVMNTISLQSSVLNPQMIGRLRKIDDKNVVYVDVCDTNLSAHLRHSDVRKQGLKKMSASFHEYRGPNDIQGIHIYNVKPENTQGAQS